MFIIYQRLIKIIFALLFLYVFFWAGRIMKFWGIDSKRWGMRALRGIIAVPVAAAASRFISVPGLMILHLLGACAVFELLGWLLKKIPALRRRERAVLWIDRVCRTGFAGLLAAALIMGYGFYNMNHIVKKEYHFTTEKPVREEGYRIALITDTHFGGVQDRDVLRKGVDKISAQKPDFVILGGDIVEEGTTAQDLQEVFQILGGIDNQYGVYYVYGNHDRQPYTDSRTYTNKELEKAITDHGIQILKDTFVTVNDELILAGRSDAWGRGRARMSSEEVLAGADFSKYVVVADHQPVELQENAALGVDLQVSGHTHAGQMWPVGVLTEWSGNYNYGNYREGNCELVVSSGYAGWSYPMRTGKHCEFVIIEIKGEA